MGARYIVLSRWHKISIAGLIIGSCIVFALLGVVYVRGVCGLKPYPSVMPNAVPTITVETTVASVSTEQTVRYYLVPQPRAVVEQFYWEQMHTVCQPQEIMPFVTQQDQQTGRTVRYAECWIRGTPEPRTSGLEAWYAWLSETKQQFSVDLIEATPSSVEVIHTEILAWKHVCA